MSKERLEELNRLLRKQEDEWRKTSDEINKLKRSMRESGSTLYKGCLFCKSKTYWDNLELSHECYTFIYVRNVLTSWRDTPEFEILTIKTTDEFIPEYLDIKSETIDNPNIFKEMKEAEENEWIILKDAFKWKLEDLLKIMPSLEDVINIKENNQ